MEKSVAESGADLGVSWDKVALSLWILTFFFTYEYGAVHISGHLQGTKGSPFSLDF